MGNMSQRRNEETVDVVSEDVRVMECDESNVNNSEHIDVSKNNDKDVDIGKNDDNIVEENSVDNSTKFVRNKDTNRDD
ncbi:hypothetical protein Tco_1071453 [Tanacetum coccineum]|uniref:Uncharacterized protein n=1 Tax=Tanacetum coccineum TaxID=301880 RepID=A0ABQ5F9D4_9ASTR